MMSRPVILASLLAAIFIGHLGEALGQNPGAPIRQNRVRVYPPSPPRDFALRVDYDKQNTPIAKQKLFQDVQDRLNKERIGIPDDRLTYFRSIIRPDSITVSGWRGIIDSIAPTRSGVIVDVRVHAFQPGLVDSAFLMERYSISQGKVQFLGASVPPPSPRMQIGY